MQKNKNSTDTINHKVNEITQHVGITMMAVAATFVGIHLPQGHSKHHAAAPLQPVFEYIPASSGGHETRREETGPHFVSYGAQRTPARAGRA